MLLALPVLATCAAQRGIARVAQPGITCTEATRVGRGALVRLGYTIDTVAEPSAAAPGKVIGRKTTGWSGHAPEAGTTYTAMVRIACSERGARFEAVTDESLIGRLDFPLSFAKAVEAVAATRVARPRIDDRPQHGVIIAVEPQRSPEALDAFGADLPAAGITPVRVQIANRTPRAYTFRAARVSLVTQDGTRRAGLPADEVAGRFDAAVQARVRAGALRDGTLAPGAELTGYLYVPAAAYRRASLVLLDQESEEPEGFSVEF
jgi:hypothetical protein